VVVDAVLLEGKKILVADDDEYNILLFHTILEKWNVAVDLAGNGREAFDMLQKKHYDIVLTDINMPEMSGIELIKKTRQELSGYHDVPFLCITANVFQDERHELFDNFVLKPFSEQDLFYKIARALKLEVQFAQAVSKDKNEVDETANSEDTVSLCDLEKFADGDWEMVKSMTQDLISNNRLHMLQINNALADKDRQRISAVAHKMQPSFAHVNAVHVVNLLLKLEHEEKTMSTAELKTTVKQLNEATSEVFTWLENKIKHLQGPVNAI
ncbi:MAG: response regulator, partial [Cyclobacteriaceae bacterium]